MKSPLHRQRGIEISDFVTKLYAQIKSNVVDDYLNTIELDYTPLYNNDIKQFTVMYGKYAPVHKGDGAFFLNCNPSATDYKTLYIYYGNEGYHFGNLDDYFDFDPSSLGTCSTNVTTIIQQYIDNKVQVVQDALSTTDSVAPVNNVTELTTVTNLIDQRVMFVEQANTLYAYDAASTEPVDGSSVLPSSTGVGRWKHVNEVINGGEF